MKQMKIVLFAVLAMVSIGFTSCIKGEDSVPTGGGMAQVVANLGYTYFKEASGFQVYPTSLSMITVENQMNFKTSTTNVAYILYNYNMDVNADAATSGKIKDADMKYAVSLDSPVEKVTSAEAPNDSLSSAPVISLNNVMTNNQDEKFTIWNNRFLITGIEYYYQKKAHSFTLVYYPQEQEEGKIKLHLRHTGTPEDDAVKTTSVNAFNEGYPFVYIRAFDLRLISATFGSEDVTVEVIADVNTYNNKLNDETNTQEKVYTVNYKK